MPLPSFLPVALLLSWLCLTVCSASAQIPPAPVDGLHDDTRAFTEETHRIVAAEIAACRQALDADIWFTAETFLPQGQTIRSRAKELRQRWSPHVDAILMAYDRASDSYALSFSPGLWQRYPSAQIVTTMQNHAVLMQQKGQPLETRLTQSLQALLQQLRTLEKQRQLAETPLHLADKRLGRFYSLVLAGSALLLSFLIMILRKRDIQAAQQVFFPAIRVGCRFGAPHGGGVIAEKESP